VARVSAAGLFERICQAAWAGGDPGPLFTDRINRDNPLPSLGRIEATNPCRNGHRMVMLGWIHVRQRDLGYLMHAAAWPGASSGVPGYTWNQARAPARPG